MLTVDIFPGTPFREREIKDFFLTAGNGNAHAVSLRFINTKRKYHGQIIIYKAYDGLCELCYKSHNNGGRERFQSDMDHLKDLLVATGGFHISMLNVSFGSSYDDLIPNAINMLYGASVKGTALANLNTNGLVLIESDGAGDPAVAAAIVENWRIDSNKTWASCRLYHSSTTSQHSLLFEAIFTKLNLDYVRICPRDERTGPMSHDILGLVSRLLSSPTSSVQELSLRVTASSESDRMLASMLKFNKSLRYLVVESYCWDSLVVTEMPRAMRETNCTLTRTILLVPVRGELSRHVHNCQEEMQFYAALNRHGRGCMRSTAFQPKKIPKLLEIAARAEGCRYGHFLYPILRENPSSWTGYLGVHGEN